MSKAIAHRGPDGDGIYCCDEGRVQAELAHRRLSIDPCDPPGLRELVDDVVVGGELAGSGFLRRPAVERLVEDDRMGREDRSKQIWHLLTLELWYRQMRALGVRA